ncbi:MAG: shikimate kinase [Acidobacteria bacterium]|nr:shikimate kinase [Acidobacteriota bacterium]
MASGKSSVGQELARRLGWEFVDLDARVEVREGKTVPEIFLQHGETRFRAAETAALEDLTKSLKHDSVVALGGGAFAQSNIRELLRPWPTVFLQAPVEELWRRCVEDPAIRPLRKDRDQFAQLHAERLPFYQKATLTVETSAKDPSVICAEIQLALQRMQGWTESAPGSSSGSNHSSETGGS